MSIQDRTNELFTRYLNGTCSPAEWEELLTLVSGIEEEDADTLIEPLQQLWEQARNKELPSRAHLIDREKMYAAITQEVETPVRRIRWQWVAAAAVVAGLLILAGLFYPDHAKKESVTVAPEQVMPGFNKAVLTLANGQQIVLDSTVTGPIGQQGGTSIANINGRLTYQANDATAHEVTYNTVTTARANQCQLVLPDGSSVWLNAASSIRFPTAFSGKNRTVEITGEAYFDVIKDALKPFHVKVRGSDIEVLGTQFNVNAYEDEASMKTSLLEGSIKLTSTTAKGKLSPGEEAVIAANGQLNIAPGNVEMAAAWKNGYFQFDKAPLPVILRQIGRWYDLDIRYEGNVPDRIFKGKIQRSLPLSGILNLLKKGGVSFRVEGKVLIVKE